MTDPDFARFLARVLPRLRLEASGFKRVGKLVQKRVSRRLRALGLADLAAYEGSLTTDALEWAWLEAACRIPISRFFRDSGVFEYLTRVALPARAADARASGRSRVRVWSAGCASGEEPYSMALAWQMGVQPTFPDVGFEVLGTDADARMLDRARRASYPAGALRELPRPWRDAAFDADGAAWCLRAPFRAQVSFRCEDLRAAQPEGPFDVVLCRNLAFSYFEPELQRHVAARLVERLLPGGVLAVGLRERLPSGAVGAAPVGESLYVRA